MDGGATRLCQLCDGGKIAVLFVGVVLLSMVASPSAVNWVGWLVFAVGISAVGGISFPCRQMFLTFSGVSIDF